MATNVVNRAGVALTPRDKIDAFLRASAFAHVWKKMATVIDVATQLKATEVIRLTTLADQLHGMAHGDVNVFIQAARAAMVPADDEAIVSLQRLFINLLTLNSIQLRLDGHHWITRSSLATVLLTKCTTFDLKQVDLKRHFDYLDRNGFLHDAWHPLNDRQLLLMTVNRGVPFKQNILDFLDPAVAIRLDMSPPNVVRVKIGEAVMDMCMALFPLLSVVFAEAKAKYTDALQEMNTNMSSYLKVTSPADY